ncbi:MAG: hypothetical protein WCT18_01190 [Patescibacteria group bacterium]
MKKIFLVLVIFFGGCEYRYFANTDSLVATGDVGASNLTNMQEDFSQQEIASDEFQEWQEFTDGPRVFYYKKDWLAEEIVFERIEGKKYQIKVRNVVARPIVGAVLPEDYWQDGKINNGYAEDYMMFQVDQYEYSAVLSWEEFLSRNFSDIVGSYDAYQVPFEPEWSAIEIKDVRGKFVGMNRFFVSSGKKIYDVRAYYSATIDEEDAWLEFVDFVGHFNF